MGVAQLNAGGFLSSGVFKDTFHPTTGVFQLSNLALKHIYEPGVRDLINSKRALSRYLHRNTKDVSGEDIHILLNTGRNNGTGYIAEGALMADPGKQKYNLAKYRTKDNYGRSMLTGKAISSSRNRAGSFINLMDGEVRGLARDIQHADNRVMFGDGSGRLCRLSDLSAIATGDYTVADPGGIPSQGLGTQYLELGMRVCTVDEAAGHLAATLRPGAASGNRALKIIGIDYSAGTIRVGVEEGGAGEVGGFSGATTGGYLYTASAISTDLTDQSCGRGNEMNGLAGIISYLNPPLQPNGLGEIPAASDPRWQSFILHAGGIPRPWDPNLLNILQDGMDQLGDGTVGMYMTTHGIRRQHAAGLIANRRFMATVDFDSGYRALSHNNIPILVDKDCTRGRVYALDLDVIEVAYENDYHWIEEDGSVLSRLENVDAFQMGMRRFANVICSARNRLGAIWDIQDV